MQLVLSRRMVAPHTHTPLCSWGLSMLQTFFGYPSPDLCLDTILSRSSTDNSFDLMAWFLLWHDLSTVGPYIDRCVPFQILSNQLNLPVVDSNQSCRNICKMINGNRMQDLSSISSLKAKGLNTCVNKLFLFLIRLQTFLKKTCFHFFIMGYCVCRLMRNKWLNPFQNKAVT